MRRNESYGLGSNMTGSGCLESCSAKCGRTSTVSRPNRLEDKSVCAARSTKYQLGTSKPVGPAAPSRPVRRTTANAAVENLAQALQALHSAHGQIFRKCSNE